MFSAVSCQGFTSTMTWNVIHNIFGTLSMTLGNNDARIRSFGPAHMSDLSQPYINILNIRNLVSISAFGMSNTHFWEFRFSLIVSTSVK
jgi:hypothetical protein